MKRFTKFFNFLIFIVGIASMTIQASYFQGEFHIRGNGDRKFYPTGNTWRTLSTIAQQYGEDNAYNNDKNFSVTKLNEKILNNVPELKQLLSNQSFELSTAAKLNLYATYQSAYKKKQSELLSTNNNSPAQNNILIAQAVLNNAFFNTNATTHQAIWLRKPTTAASTTVNNNQPLLTIPVDTQELSDEKLKEIAALLKRLNEQ